MKSASVLTLLALFTAGLCAEEPAPPKPKAGDWAQWGGSNDRNMVSDEKNLPDDWDAGKKIGDTEEIDPKTTKNVKWVVKLGSQSYGNPVISQGKVLVGTNNESPRDPKYNLPDKRPSDRGVVMCFNEADGKFLWQLCSPKLPSGKVNDWEYLGICSSPLVEGNRVYVVTNRCEVLCLDLNGMANGNDGPFKDEAKYFGGAGKPIEPGPTDADIIWQYDMMDELGVFPHNMSNCSILMLGDTLYVNTSNGQDWSHVNIPSPNSPSLIALDKKTGQILGEDDAGIGRRLFHGQWSSPSAGLVNGKLQIFFGGGDGWLYAFDPTPVKEGDHDHIKTLWRFDCNPPEYKTKDGKKIKYPDANGVSEVIATPVLYKGKIYAATGQDPEHGEGLGIFTCIDPTKSGDVTTSGCVWNYKDIKRSISTVSIVDDLVFVGDFSGNVHCLDAATGKVNWVYPTKSHIWGSSLAADGKVYIGNEEGDIYIFKVSKEKQEPKKISMGAPVFSSPVAANGVLYIATQTHLYAIQTEKK